jgi:hypothetical protein
MQEAFSALANPTASIEVQAAGDWALKDPRDATENNHEQQSFANRLIPADLRSASNHICGAHSRACFKNGSLKGHGFSRAVRRLIKSGL